jgi:hypothetical protein
MSSWGQYVHTETKASPGRVMKMERDGYVHCLFITVYKKCKIVIVRHKIQVRV